MHQKKFSSLEVGTLVLYVVGNKKLGSGEHNFYYKIVKINKDNETVDIERYSKIDNKPDQERKILKENVSLENIEFLDPKDKLKNIDPRNFF